MRHWKQRPAEPALPDGPASPADLVIIGHVGFATDRTINGSISYVGGSGFVVAFAASALLDGVGLVAQVGEDFDLDVLGRLPVNMAGIGVRPGASARPRLDQARESP